MQVRIDESGSHSASSASSSPICGRRLARKRGELPPNRVALGYVEGWRGSLHWICAAGQSAARCEIKDPSLQTGPPSAKR
jgi:hypothetical protein